VTTEIWQKYLQTRDQETRDALVREFLPLVKQVASRLSIGLPPQVEEDDLIASGIIGLLEAIDRYNPPSEATFETFATWRIRGAMLDELRRLSWSPRSLFQRLRQLQEAKQKLRHALGRNPSTPELARELDWMPSAVDEVYTQMNYCSFVSLESLLFVPSTPIFPGEDFLLFGDNFTPPEKVLERKERRRLLARAIEDLSEREKLFLSLYYKEELTLREIGVILKVSTARVSQIHAEILGKLREKLRKWGHLEN
jgi:RNA polymerase sigma factor for flagellar operon FliA